MQSKLHESVLRVLGQCVEPITSCDITESLIMGNESCDLGAMPLREMHNFLENAIAIEGDSCPILKVGPGYILKSNADPDILLDFPEEISIAQKNSGGKSGAVTCYGYSWIREMVYWCSRPKLIGYQFLTPVDFSEQIGIYILQSQDGKVKFVGFTADRSLGECLFEHTVDHLEEEWCLFSFFGFRPVANNGIFGRLPESVKMPEILPSIGKIIQEIEKLPSDIPYPDYHVLLRFNQWGNHLLQK